MIVTDRIRIDPPYRSALAACGLDRVESLLTRVDGRVAAWSRTTDTLYVPCPNGRPGFYLKRYYYPRWRNRLRSAFRGSFFRMHRGQAEARLLKTMRSLGLPAVRPVAYGSRRIGHFVQACFLITEEVPQARNLTAFARDVATGREQLSREDRVRMVRCLATQLAAVHAAGFVHGQLFWRNMLVRLGPLGQPEFFFLDARPRRGGRRLGRSGLWWLDELGHVAASALPFTTRTDRLRFVLQYFGAERFTAEIRAHARVVDTRAKRWQRHEAQRIKMNDLFESWNRRLDAERTEENVLADAGHAPLGCPP